MKTLKKIALGLLVAASLSGVSSLAFAEGDSGRIVYPPAVAIDMVSEKLQNALNALKTGASPEEVSKLAKEGLDISKEVNANDRVDVQRSKANNMVKAAREHLRQGSIQEAEQELGNAIQKFQSLKSLI